MDKNPTQKLKELLEEMIIQRDFYIEVMEIDFIIELTKPELQERINYLNEKIQLLENEFKS